MWYAIYETAGGALVSTGTVVAAPLPEGVSIKQLSGDPAGMEWNPATLDFELVVRLPDFWTVYEFLKRMTAQERIKIRARASTDVIVYDFVDLLNRSGEVIRTNPDVAAGLGYLEQLGDLGIGRAQEIING